MKAYKLEVLIIDQDVQSIENAEEIISETRYPNHTIVDVITCREAEIGEYDDDHLLNSPETDIEEMNRLFPVILKEK